jgi:hypothetical protein
MRGPEPKARHTAIIVALAAACSHAPRQTAPARPRSTSGSPARGTSVAPDSTREYHGEWESGFEISTFRGCDGTLPDNIWVSLAADANVGTRWLDSSGAGGVRRYYVRVRGILRGPADRRRPGAGYGHLGGADYELYITRVLEVKPPGEPNCTIRR